MTSCRVSKRSAAGFSLIELLVAIGIVGILASIAVPSYLSSIRKSRRTEARTAVLDLAGREERYFSTNNKYSATAADLGYASFASVGSGYYKVSIDVPAAGTFTIKAEPVAGKGQEKDTDCASFSVTNTGKQSAADSSATDTTAKCWG